MRCDCCPQCDCDAGECITCNTCTRCVLRCTCCPMCGRLPQDCMCCEECQRPLGECACCEECGMPPSRRHGSGCSRAARMGEVRVRSRLSDRSSYCCDACRAAAEWTPETDEEYA